VVVSAFLLATLYDILSNYTVAILQHCLRLNIVHYPDGTEKWVLPVNEKDVEEFDAIYAEYDRDFYLR
jgi:hypothetical protein